MNSNSLRFSGPVIVYVMLLVYLFMLYLIIDTNDITDSSRLFLRVSGRLAIFLFFISFGASALHRLFTAEWTRYLIKNRRYFGISTGILLWAHFLVIISMSFTAPAWFKVSVPWYILYSGSLTFILVGLMALTSNDYAQKKLGIRVWKNLHLLGGYAALASFAGEYVLVLYLQPIILPDYEFGIQNTPALIYALFFVPLILLFLRVFLKKGSS